MSRLFVRTCRGMLAACLFTSAVVAQAPANDSCATALGVFDGVNPSSPSGFSGNTYTNVGATNSPNYGVDCATNGAGHFNKDVFFTYNASYTGDIKVSTCTPPGFAAGTLADTVLSVYAVGACPSGGAAIACNDDFCTQLSSLTFSAVQGQNYLFRVGSWSATLSGTFYLTVAPQMPNDLCFLASTLAVGSQPFPTITLGSTYGMTNDASIPACGQSSSADVWYTYTAPSPQWLAVSATGFGVKTLSVHVGGCPTPGMSPAACSSSAPLSINVLLAAGETASVRVRAGAAFEQGAFTLWAWTAASDVGDSCAAPVPVVDGLNPPSGTYSMANITEIGETPVSGAYCGPIGSLNRSMWFRYVASTDGPIEVTTCTAQAGTPNALDQALVWVYADSCGTNPISGCPIDNCNVAGRSRAGFVAQAGSAYRIRVGVPFGAANLGGLFNLHIGLDNTTCSKASSLQFGTLHSSTAASPTGELFYSVTPASSCMVQLVLVSGENENFLADATSCNLLANAPDIFGQTVFYAAAGQTHFVRVRKNGAVGGVFDLYYACLGSPVNDEPAGAIALVDGVNPTPPNGDSATVFHNVGATTTPGMSSCFGLLNDVFFTYTAGPSERVKIALCPPAGLPMPSLADPVMQLIQGPAATGSVIACSDDVCGYYPSITFVSSPFGGLYTIRIGEWSGGLGGTFRIVVDRQLSLVMTSPLGAGSIKIENKFGEAYAGYFTVLTLNAGGYPYGPFFGIEPAISEIILQLQSNAAPFLGALDANGTSTFGPVAGLPPLDVYGVTLALSPFGYIDEVSAPAHRATY